MAVIWEEGFGPCVGCLYEDENCGNYIPETGECALDEGAKNTEQQVQADSSAPNSLTQC